MAPETLVPKAEALGCARTVRALAALRPGGWFALECHVCRVVSLPRLISSVAVANLQPDLHEDVAYQSIYFAFVFGTELRWCRQCVWFVTQHSSRTAVGLRLGRQNPHTAHEQTTKS